MIREYIIKIDDDDEKKDFRGGMPLVEKPKDLVRCKDCKHGRLYDGNLIDCELNELAKEADFFCADGKRR